MLLSFSQAPAPRACFLTGLVLPVAQQACRFQDIYIYILNYIDTSLYIYIYIHIYIYIYTYIHIYIYIYIYIHMCIHKATRTRNPTR